MPLLQLGDVDVAPEDRHRFQVTTKFQKKGASAAENGHHSTQKPMDHCEVWMGGGPIWLDIRMLVSQCLINDWDSIIP